MKVATRLSLRRMGRVTSSLFSCGTIRYEVVKLSSGRTLNESGT
jgi:hypothetical protein